MAYDANANRSAVTDFNGNLTCYAYDLARNLETQRTEGLTGNACPGTRTAATRTVSTQWHPQFRLPVQVAEPKRITSYAYDANGNLVAKTVQPTSDVDGSTGFSATPVGSPRTWLWTHTYHPTIPGFITQTVMNGPRTDVADLTVYTYDSASGALASVANALGHTTTLSDFDAHGRARRITDPNGLITTLAYDLRGRLVSRSVGGETTAYQYDGVGQLTRVTNPDGSYLAYTYDAAHRLTAVTDNLGNRIAYTLDAMGNRVQEQVSDPNNVLTQTRARVYDGLNRLVQDIGANSGAEITAYAYDAQGNRIATTDPLNRVTTQAFDALNRLVAMLDPAGGQTRMAYDGLDQLTAVTDPKNLTTGYTLDGLGNLAQQASPDTGLTANAYDAAGNLTASLDAAGVQATYAYDALNRITTATYTAPAGAGFTSTAIAYTYDQGVNGIGRLTGLTDATGSTAYRYDQKGRLIQDTRTIGGVTYTTAYQYDAAGRLTGITYPGGRQLTYTLDALGRIARIDTTLNGQSVPVVQNAAYRPFGQLAGFAFGNGQAYARSFDLNGRVTGYSLAPGQSGTLTYDAAGRITQRTNSATPSVPAQFGYDALDRLTGYTQGTTSWSYAYDPNGNRTGLTIGGVTYAYTLSTTSNQLNATAGPTPTTYGYNAVGNLAQTNAASFAYDARHRLIGVTSGSGASATSTTYQLNALGQRVQKSPPANSGSGATVFHYDQSGKLIAESDAAGNIKTSYVWLDDTPVGVITAGTASGACNVTSPTPDPGTSFTPFNALTRLEVRSGRPNNADWQWGLGTNTQQAGSFVQAYLNWVSGRQYDFTLTYTGQGAGTYTVSYAGTTLFSKTWSSGLQAGNALQFYARTSAGIGAGNYITVNLASINGTAVNATLRTAGDNLLNEAKATYAIPNGGSGFTVTGKIAFTFTGSAPPTGSRMNFFVTAGTVTCQTSAEALYYVSADHLDTPRAISDSAGNQVWSWDGEPFGVTPASTQGTFTFNLRFPGQYFDRETGLHYNYFRDYEPQVGRYVESDPIGLKGGINTYTYVSNRPLTLFDTKGLDEGAGVDLIQSIIEGIEGATAAVKCKTYYCTKRRVPTWDEILEWCLQNYGGSALDCHSKCLSLTVRDPKYKKECVDKTSCL